MGWKNVKEHYQIDHIVCVTDKGICIGSPYCHDLIVINQWQKKIMHPHESLGRSEDLTRYWDEMHADLDKLWDLIEKPDMFANSITVYTYRDSEIIEKQCEEPGWPNVTHDGELMYVNTFSTDRKVTVNRAIRNSAAAANSSLEYLTQIENDLTKTRARLGKYQADLATLRFEALHGSVGEPELERGVEA